MTHAQRPVSTGTLVGLPRPQNGGRRLFPDPHRPLVGGKAGAAVVAGRPLRRWALRGRDQELDRLVNLLSVVAECGRSAVVLIEGSPGIGKSRLLAEAEKAAAERGFKAVYGAADELLQLAPLAPLVAALDESPPTLGAGDTISVSDRQMWLIEHFRARLEERLTRAPMLVALDDLQWADPVTLLALRTLPSRLAAYPLVWMLARCSGEGGHGVDRLYGLLEETGSAVRMELGPLPDDAVTDLVGDLLHAAPGPDLHDLAEGADGNPFTLIELVEGLVEEGAIHIDGGKAQFAVSAAAARASTSASSLRACPLPIQLPKRFHTLMRKRLDALSPQTRRLLEVAAVLGRSFTPDDVAEMLAEPAAALVSALQEALAVRLLVCTAEKLAFRHDLIWQTLLETVPIPVRGALHRQAADMLLRRGSSAVPAAMHLIHGARRDDSGAVEVLGLAAEEVLARFPQTAAELAMRGLELIEPEDPARLTLTVTAVEALTRAGPLPMATDLARDGLARSLPTAPTASLQCWLSTALLLSGHTIDALAVAEKVLAEPDLPVDLRDAAVLNHLSGLSTLDEHAAAQYAEDILGEAEHHNQDVRVGTLTVLAGVRWREGRLDEGLRLAREAVSHAEGRAAVAWHTHPNLTLAIMLTHLREFAEATAAINAAHEEIEFLGAKVLSGVPNILRSLLEVATGRPDDAVAEATVGLAIADEVGMPLYTPIAWGVLATVALHRGDLMTAARHAERLQGALSLDGTCAWSAQCTWVTAQVAAANGDQQGVLRALAEIDRDPSVRRALLIEEPAAAAWLIRAAFAEGAHEQAAVVIATAERLAADNPGIPAVLVAAAHARGLYDRDPDALQRAATKHHDPWARASAAEDLAAVLIDTDRDAAIRHLDHAMAIYGPTGAERDAARVRRRLRHLGVRRRHWTYADHPTTGWASLTKTERAVANLVAQGLTNRQVASQMFLSPHTVGFHLRQIFRKLGINSRVDLARHSPRVPRQPGDWPGSGGISHESRGTS
ncbi:MAG: helix-turn-helix transcriptional regulator [Egibacteraceae bacterium]